MWRTTSEPFVFVRNISNPFPLATDLHTNPLRRGSRTLGSSPVRRTLSSISNRTGTLAKVRLAHLLQRFHIYVPALRVTAFPARTFLDHLWELVQSQTEARLSGDRSPPQAKFYIPNADISAGVAVHQRAYEPHQKSLGQTLHLSVRRSPKRSASVDTEAMTRSGHVLPIQRIDCATHRLFVQKPIKTTTSVLTQRVSPGLFRGGRAVVCSGCKPSLSQWAFDRFPDTDDDVARSF